MKNNVVRVHVVLIYCFRKQVDMSERLPYLVTRRATFDDNTPSIEEENNSKVNKHIPDGVEQSMITKQPNEVYQHDETHTTGKSGNNKQHKLEKISSIDEDSNNTDNCHTDQLEESPIRSTTLITAKIAADYETAFASLPTLAVNNMAIEDTSSGSVQISPAYEDISIEQPSNHDYENVTIPLTLLVPMTSGPSPAISNQTSRDSGYSNTGFETVELKYEEERQCTQELNKYQGEGNYINTGIEDIRCQGVEFLQHLDLTLGQNGSDVVQNRGQARDNTHDNTLLTEFQHSNNSSVHVNYRTQHTSAASVEITSPKPVSADVISERFAYLLSEDSSPTLPQPSIEIMTSSTTELRHAVLDAYPHVDALKALIINNNSRSAITSSSSKLLNSGHTDVSNNNNVDIDTTAVKRLRDFLALMDDKD